MKFCTHDYFGIHSGMACEVQPDTRFYHPGEHLAKEENKAIAELDDQDMEAQYGYPLRPEPIPETTKFVRLSPTKNNLKFAGALGVSFLAGVLGLHLITR